MPTGEEDQDLQLVYPIVVPNLDNMFNLDCFHFNKVKNSIANIYKYLISLENKMGAATHQLEELEPLLAKTQKMEKKQAEMFLEQQRLDRTDINFQKQINDLENKIRTGLDEKIPEVEQACKDNSDKFK